MQFENTEGVHIDEVKYSVQLLEGVEFNAKNPVEKEIIEFLPTIKKQTISLDNGAEGHFVYS